ncbi:hypothetical protein [Herbaspirillum autotrophicum]|uniref:hypothetical protein n=1 Tax=Herbaspirillum autotrophicum TaxID=180195 RepID=UPI0012EDC15E|nr:hypothetical protein [Herbaspirillum autotrophicum]
MSVIEEIRFKSDGGCLRDSCAEQALMTFFRDKTRLFFESFLILKIRHAFYTDALVRDDKYHK